MVLVLGNYLEYLLHRMQLSSERYVLTMYSTKCNTHMVFSTGSTVRSSLYIYHKYVIFSGITTTEYCRVYSMGMGLLRKSYLQYKGKNP